MLFIKATGGKYTSLTLVISDMLLSCEQTLDRSTQWADNKQKHVMPYTYYVYKAAASTREVFCYRYSYEKAVCPSVCRPSVSLFVC